MNEESVPLPLRQIDFAPLHERVYLELRKALIAGRFEPGQKLTSRKLAAALGTSDMPVRAAISRLTAEGGLEQQPNGTFMVPMLRREQFREVMELRAVLEGRATGLACGRIDDDGFRRLDEYSNTLDSAARSDDIVAYLDANQKLKFAIYSYCNSPTLEWLIGMLWLRAGPALRFHTHLLHQIAHINFHLEAIAALRAHRRKAAGGAIMRDILEGMRALLSVASFADEGRSSGTSAPSETRSGAQRRGP